MDFILHKFVIEFYRPETLVLRQGDSPDKFYAVTEGEFEVYCKDEYGIDKRVQVLTSPGFFGEIALIYNTKRTASIFTNGYASAATLE